MLSLLYILLVMVCMEIGNAKNLSAICKKKQCLKYEMIQNLGKVELRCYPAQLWISSNVQETSMSYALEVNLRQLTQYRNKRNRKEATLDVMVPYVVQIPACGSFLCPRNFTTSMQLPPGFQKSPPLPMEQSLFLSPVGKRCVYVKGFVGRPSEVRIRNEARLMRLALARKDIFTYEYFKYFLAKYDEKLDSGMLYNEIWFLKRY